MLPGVRALQLLPVNQRVNPTKAIILPISLSKREIFATLEMDCKSPGIRR
jgi:hypothetical protein